MNPFIAIALSAIGIPVGYAIVCGIGSLFMALVHFGLFLGSFSANPTAFFVDTLAFSAVSTGLCICVIAECIDCTSSYVDTLERWKTYHAQGVRTYVLALIGFLAAGVNMLFLISAIDMSIPDLYEAEVFVGIAAGALCFLYGAGEFVHSTYHLLTNRRTIRRSAVG